jgi:hypothetical protein
MGTFTVDTQKKPGILWLTLSGTFTPEEMDKFVEAHNLGVDQFAAQDYRVFCDIRELQPLSAECAARFEVAKGYSNAHPNFRGSAVWASSALVGMQHRRTSSAAGVMETELISADEQALWAHLEKVYRTAPGA